MSNKETKRKPTGTRVDPTTGEDIPTDSVGDVPTTGRAQKNKNNAEKPKIRTHDMRTAILANIKLTEEMFHAGIERYFSHQKKIEATRNKLFQLEQEYSVYSDVMGKYLKQNPKLKKKKTR